MYWEAVPSEQRIAFKEAQPPITQVEVNSSWVHSERDVASARRNRTVASHGPFGGFFFSTSLDPVPLFVNSFVAALTYAGCPTHCKEQTSLCLTAKHRGLAVGRMHCSETQDEFDQCICQ